MPRRGHELRIACAVLFATVGLSCAAMAEPAKPLTPDSAVSDYCAAWSVADRGARDRLLARVWAADGVYSDPEPTLAKGRAALSDVIANFQRHYPGAHFRCSAPQMHHRAMRVTWILLRPDGSQVTHGVDIYDMARDGRIQRIVGFFGEPPSVTPLLPAKASAAAQAAPPDDPIQGTWKLNAEKSTFTPGPGWQSQIRVYQGIPAGVSVTWTGVGAGGESMQVSYTYQYDGRDYPMKGSASYDTLNAVRIDERTVRSEEKRDGKIVGIAVRAVSPDGKLLTITDEGTNRKGQKFSQVLVFDRATTN
jgi:hypothetical protein